MKPNLCIIALATARPGTTIVISCAGTRDSDRLAPWEWAAGCMGPALFLSTVCVSVVYVGSALVGSALLPPSPPLWLPWAGLVFFSFASKYRASGTKPHHATSHPRQPTRTRPCLLLTLAVGREREKTNQPPRPPRKVVGQQSALRGVGRVSLSHPASRASEQATGETICLGAGL